MHGAQHGLMEFFLRKSEVLIWQNDCSGNESKLWSDWEGQKEEHYMCISSFFVSIFRGSPGTKQQLLQTSIPCPEQQPSPIPIILLQPRAVWLQTQHVLLSGKRQAQDTSAKDIPNLSSVSITDTKHWDTDVALGA